MHHGSGSETPRPRIYDNENRIKHTYREQATGMGTFELKQAGTFDRPSRDLGDRAAAARLDSAWSTLTPPTEG